MSRCDVRNPKSETKSNTWGTSEQNSNVEDGSPMDSLRRSQKSEDRSQSYGLSTGRLTVLTEKRDDGRWTRDEGRNIECRTRNIECRSEKIKGRGFDSYVVLRILYCVRQSLWVKWLGKFSLTGIADLGIVW